MIKPFHIKDLQYNTQQVYNQSFNIQFTELCPSVSIRLEADDPEKLVYCNTYYIKQEAGMFHKQGWQQVRI